MSKVEQRLIVTRPQGGVYPDYEELVSLVTALVERVKAVEDARAVVDEEFDRWIDDNKEQNDGKD